MKHAQLIYLFFIFLLCSCGERLRVLESENLISKYEVIHRDTVIRNHIEGIKGEDNYKIQSIQRIQADVILNDFPKTYDSAIFVSEIQTILKAENLSVAYIFRDEFSSLLLKMSSMTADSLLKAGRGYLGRFEIE